jgi:hypothetical protein
VTLAKKEKEMKVEVLTVCCAALTGVSVLGQGANQSTNMVPVPTQVAQTGRLERTDIRDEHYRATTNGQVVAFEGLLLAKKENGKIVRARIGNMDDGMKTSYYIVLDEKGLQLAAVESKAGLVKVKGRVEIKDGDNWLVVQEFKAKK